MAAVRVTLVPVQIFVSEDEIEITGCNTSLTFMVTGFDSAVEIPEQVTAPASKKQVTTSPFCKLAEEKAVLFVPALLPFIFHWYNGLFPLAVAVALKKTGVPLQMLVALAAMVMAGVIFGRMVT